MYYQNDEYSPIDKQILLQEGLRGNNIYNTSSSILNGNSPSGELNHSYFAQSNLQPCQFSATTFNSSVYDPQNSSIAPIGPYFQQNLMQTEQNLIRSERTSLETRNQLEEQYSEDLETIERQKYQFKTSSSQTIQNYLPNLHCNSQDIRGKAESQITQIPSCSLAENQQTNPNYGQLKRHQNSSISPSPLFEQIGGQQLKIGNSHLSQESQIYPQAGNIFYDKQFIKQGRDGDQNFEFYQNQAQQNELNGVEYQQNFYSNQFLQQQKQQSVISLAHNNNNLTKCGFQAIPHQNNQKQGNIYYESQQNYCHQFLPFSPKVTLIQQPQQEFPQYISQTQQYQQQIPFHYYQQDEQIAPHCTYLKDQNIQQNQQYEQERYYGAQNQMNYHQWNQQIQQIEKSNIQLKEKIQLTQQPLIDYQKVQNYNNGILLEAKQDHQQTMAQQIDNEIFNQKDEKVESKESSSVSSHEDLDDKSEKSLKSKVSKKISAKKSSITNLKQHKPLKETSSNESQKQEILEQTKKQINETKNIPKNYSKAIIGYIQKHPQECSKLLGKEYTFSEFENYLWNQKENLTAIKDLRSLWTINVEDPQQKVFNRVFRILSFKFFRENAISYIFSSKKIKNTRALITYRFILQRALHNPESFSFMKFQN